MSRPARDDSSADPNHFASAAEPETDTQPEQPGISGNFYRGLIVFLDSVRGHGTIRTYSGREIRFEFPFVRVVGAPIGGRAPGIDRLRRGDTVGFDVGWTSKGLRVTTIKPASG
jgi:hypothetical protein